MKNTSSQDAVNTDFLMPDPFRQKVIAELACVIMARWQLDDCVQFKLSGLQCRFEYQMWKHKVFTTLSPDVYLRLTALIELNRLLKAFCSSIQQASIWLSTPNPAFELESPLDHMLTYGFEGTRHICNTLYSDEQKCTPRIFIH